MRLRSGLPAILAACIFWSLSAPAAGGAAPRATANAAPAAAGFASPTGNLLVLLDRDHATAASASAALRARVANLGARPAGKSVPQIGLITVRPPAGVSPEAFADRLRGLPGVSSVEPERRYALRLVPDDPALSTLDPAGSGVDVQWVLAREGFYGAWDISKGDGALVGVIDTGIDASHPEFAGKLDGAPVDQQDPSLSTGPANTDQDGHGTHVASLACAATNNGIGLAGAGYDCKLVIEKSDLTDSSIAASIVDATDRHVQAINMSFGSADTSRPAPDSEIRALQYAAAHKVVLVAAAADTPGTEQGDPANVLQPAGTGSDIAKGIGLDVTAAQAGGTRASFAGSGSEISLAAYGALQPDQSVLPGVGPPPGIFGAFPANTTELETTELCACRTTFDGSSDYAYLEGTSMAAPQVAAVGAMMRQLNPFASLADVLETIKRTAQRPSGTGWTADLGWGILNAGAALDAIRRLDREPPVARLSAPRVARHPTFRLRWRGHDATYPKLIPSGIAAFDVYVGTRGHRRRLIAHTSKHSLEFHGKPGRRYTFYLVAIDRAGNRERPAAHATTRVRR